MYYVSYIEEYPIYEPAEGGYYYAGERVMDCKSFPTWKKANKCFQEWRKWFLDEYGCFEEDRKRINENLPGGVGKHIYPEIAFYAKHIGDGASVQITRKKPQDHGWHPYE